ncbi:hypothetical protein ACLIL3_014875 [Acinetobacter radioresistens]|uniref:hypothetical protein n=1 Tax=Acinetobacter radioresistens TaxID=40216 RepID=UPI003984D94D
MKKPEQKDVKAHLIARGEKEFDAGDLVDTHNFAADQLKDAFVLLRSIEAELSSSVKTAGLDETRLFEGVFRLIRISLETVEEHAEVHQKLSEVHEKEWRGNGQQ